jgi:hypothetical protein
MTTDVPVIKHTAIGQTGHDCERQIIIKGKAQDNMIEKPRYMARKKKYYSMLAGSSSS